MRRVFVPFDEGTLQKELDELSSKDAAKLAALMSHYEQCGFANPSPARWMTMAMGFSGCGTLSLPIRDRLLFFASNRSAGFEQLVMLVVYKKQGQKAPQHVVETARRRKKQWEEARRKA